MVKNLVIVESPAKAKTIEKFLGSEFKVMSSYGHIRDLKPKSFSIDIDKDFKPIYEIPADKKDIVNSLRKAAKEADSVWLASDEDREGEAIAWHLAEVLNLDVATTPRIVFHEITKKAILNALKTPRTIDLNRVDAQQARRVLDRIVGFELSPVLWRKVKPSLSAGRVQSVAVRLIVERENEIKNFVSEKYFRIHAYFSSPGSEEFRGDFNRRVATEKEAKQILEESASSTAKVKEITTKPLHKSPAPPFTTSTLQQEAARKLGFTVAQTMLVAQRLYESGHITYMRTDSLNLSEEAVKAVSDEIVSSMGSEYLKIRRYHTHSKGAQEAHEAIRPTDISVVEPADCNERERKLYNLIRLRTIASQMADAQINKTNVDIELSSGEMFSATGEVITFDGFLKVYAESRDEEGEAPSGMSLLPVLRRGDNLAVSTVTAIERYTQQPPRYTEASLVKKMEELGIGRPSTYAPTISTIQSRDYITKGEREGTPRQVKVITIDRNRCLSEEVRTEVTGSDKGRLVPTDIGVVVNEFLTEYFPEILDYNFTASVEEKFDEISEGKRSWESEMRTFYEDFHPRVDRALNMRLEHKVGDRFLGNDADGLPVYVKIGRFGPMVQIGESDAQQKPRFASLLKGQSMSEITLDDALKLFDFPRVLGEFEDADLTVAVGRFGPYVRHQNKFYSIPKDLEPTALTLDEAIELIKEKRTADAGRIVKTFEEEPSIQILKGRYGIYIAKGKTNYKIPKTVVDPSTLSLDQVLDIIKAQDENSAQSIRRKSARKKS